MSLLSSLLLISAPPVESLIISVISSALAVKLFDIIYNEVNRRRQAKLQAVAAHASQSAEVRRVGIEEVDVVITTLRDEVHRLQQSIADCQEEHRQCNQSINKLTIENLRLLGRSQQHEWQINDLQRKLGIEVTDFGRQERENIKNGTTKGQNPPSG